MKRKTAICFLLFLTMTMCFGQKKDSANIFRLPNNSIYSEVIGTSLLYSLNYERIIYNVKRFYISGRIGASYLKILDFEAFISPVLFNGIIHCYKSLYFEFGSGMTFIKNINIVQKQGNNQSEFNYASASNLGVRIQNKTGFLFRVGFTPLYIFKDFEPNFLPLCGVSFGYSFGRKYK